jgi:bacteriocin-like protein
MQRCIWRFAFHRATERHRAERLNAQEALEGQFGGPDVMAITKCRIWVPAVNRFTVAPRALRQGGRTSDRMVRAGLTEKIMSKTHNSEAMSNHVRELTNQVNELTTDELEHVSGGKLLEAAVKGHVYKSVEIHGTA